jgi:hypothetical protein
MDICGKFTGSEFLLEIIAIKSWLINPYITDYERFRPIYSSELEMSFNFTVVNSVSTMASEQIPSL